MSDNGAEIVGDPSHAFQSLNMPVRLFQGKMLDQSPETTRVARNSEQKTANSFLLRLRALEQFRPTVLWSHGCRPGFNMYGLVLNDKFQTDIYYCCFLHIASGVLLKVWFLSLFTFLKSGQVSLMRVCFFHLKLGNTTSHHIAESSLSVWIKLE